LTFEFICRYTQTPKAAIQAKTGAELAADAKISSSKEIVDEKPAKQWKATAEDGLNLLADLLGSSSKESDCKPFKINLFADDPFDEYKLNSIAFS